MENCSKVVLFFALCIGVFAHGSWAQEWRTKLDRALKSFESSHYKVAAQQLELLEPIVEDHFGSNPEDTTYAGLLESLGQCYEMLGDNKKSEIKYLTSKASYKAITGDSSKNYARITVLLGSLYSDMGRYADANVEFDVAQRIYKKVFWEENIIYADLINNIGLLKDRMGLYQEAIPHYKTSLSIFKKNSNNTEEYASVLNNLAISYYHMGRFAESEKYYLESLQLNKNIHGARSAEYAKILSNLSSLYKIVGRFKESIELTSESLEIRKHIHGEHHPIYANSLNNLASIYSDMGELGKAVELYRQAIEIEKDNNPTEYAIFLNNLARAYQSMELYLESEHTFHKALKVFGEAHGVDHPYYAIFQKNLGYLYFVKGDYTSTEILWEQVLAVQKKRLGEDNAFYAKAILNLGLLKNRMGKYEESKTMIEQGTEKLLKLIDQSYQFMSSRDKKQFWYMVSESFEQLNYDLSSSYINGHQQQMAGLMYDVQLAIKALILDSSRKIKYIINQSQDSSIIALYDTWVAKREQVSKAYSLPASARLDKGIDLSSLNDTISWLEKQLAIKSQVFSNNAINRWKWQDVQKCLKEGEVAIELIRTREFDMGFTDSVRYIALIITSDPLQQPKMVIIPNGNQLENDLLRKYKTALEHHEQTGGLYSYYCSPIAAALPGISKVYLSVDGVYNIINLNTLYNPETNSYVLDEIDIQQVTSTKDLIRFKKYPSEINLPRSAVLMGDPMYNFTDSEYRELIASSDDISRSTHSLDGVIAVQELLPLSNSRTEIINIQGLLEEEGWQVKTYVEKEAIEENAKNSHNPTILHIATHGYFDQNPNIKMTPTIKLNLDQLPLMKSGLLLAGASNYYNTDDRPGVEDGILTAYESATLDLQATELVVLSACESGLGEISIGEGVYGMQRGFTIAGARSILMSLWKVNDAATQELMSTFYRNWLESGDKRQAFRQAQISLREKYPKPIHWGGFVMVGENTILKSQSYLTTWLFLLLVSIVIISMVLYHSYNKTKMRVKQG